MSTIAIVGAGSGVGAAVARRFGREGFRVALFSRNQAKLDGLAAELSEQDITARGFAVDVRDSIALTVALEAASSELGPIEVLQYSPIPHRDFLKPISEISITDLTGAVEFSIYGPFTAVAAGAPRHAKPAPGNDCLRQWGNFSPPSRAVRRNVDCVCR